MLQAKETYQRDCVQRGIRLFWHTLSKARDMCLHTGEIEYVMSVPRGGPERIIDLHLPAGAEQGFIDGLAARMKAGELPDSILVPLDPDPPDLVDRLQRSGFSFDTSGLCMVMDLKTLPGTLPSTPGIQVEVVNDLEKLRQWVDIVNVAMVGSEMMPFDRFLDIYHLDHTEFFLASRDGVPASAAMIVMENELASLEFVATLKEHRHMGLGSAVTLFALSSMRVYGIKTATLRAEPDGIHVYQRAGFQVVCPRLVAFPK